MKKIILAAILGAGAPPLGAQIFESNSGYQGNKIGVGVGYSGAIGLSLYADTSRDHFVQGIVGFAPVGNLIFTADYAFAYHGSIDRLPTLSPYWGLGAIVVNDQQNSWHRYTGTEVRRVHGGARIPIGLNFVIPDTPVQLSVEVVPTLMISQAVFGYLEGGASARILF